MPRNTWILPKLLTTMSSILRLSKIPSTVILPSIGVAPTYRGYANCLLHWDPAPPAHPILNGDYIGEDSQVVRARVIWTRAGLQVRYGIEEALFGQTEPIVYQLVVP